MVTSGDSPSVSRDPISRTNRLTRVVLLLGITVALLGVIPAADTVHDAEPPAGSAHAVVYGSPDAGQTYPVIFTESGLPLYTNWSVTIRGLTLNSTANSIVFLEPNGTYLFAVGAVPGYTAYPEGNVTVNGQVVTEWLNFTTTGPKSSCTSYVWEGDDITLFTDCRGFFETDLRSYNASTGYTFENSTFRVGAIAEVGAGGGLAALFVTGHDSTGNISLTNTSYGVNVTDTIDGTVTNAVGLNASSGNPNGQTPAWSPADAPGNVGPTIWGSGSESLGNVTVVITFHFASSGGATDRVEFDVSVIGWPWVSDTDSLGVEVDATAEMQTHFVYSPSTDTIGELWNANGTAASSLVFGLSANATSGGENTSLTVANDVGLFPSGSEPVEAFSLLAFHGPGGYSALVYDPWIVFGPAASLIVPPPIVPGSSGGGATLPLVAVGVVAAGTTALGFLAYRQRRAPVDKELAPLAWPGHPVRPTT